MTYLDHVVVVDVVSVWSVVRRGIVSLLKFFVKLRYLFSTLTKKSKYFAVWSSFLRCVALHMMMMMMMMMAVFLVQGRGVRSRFKKKISGKTKKRQLQMQQQIRLVATSSNT